MAVLFKFLVLSIKTIVRERFYKKYRLSDHIFKNDGKINNFSLHFLLAVNGLDIKSKSLSSTKFLLSNDQLCYTFLLFLVSCIVSSFFLQNYDQHN